MRNKIENVLFYVFIFPLVVVSFSVAAIAIWLDDHWHGVGHEDE